MITILASLFIIAGYILVAWFKSRTGFPVQNAGCLIFLYMYYGVDTGVLLTNGVFTLVNIIGFFKWNKTK